MCPRTGSDYGPLWTLIKLNFGFRKIRATTEHFGHQLLKKGYGSYHTVSLPWQREVFPFRQTKIS